MTSPRTSPYTHLPPLAWLVSALVLLSLLGWSGVPATSAPPVPALTLHSPAPGALHLTWPAVTPAPPAYHVQYAPADTPLLIKEATSSTHTLTLYELEPGVLYTVQVRAGTGPWSAPVLQRIDDYRADRETVGTIGVGAEEAGYIESAGDTDWFFVDLAAGEGYPIEVTGAPAPPLAVYEATGAVVQQGLAWHHASALTFTPAIAGLYHVAVGGPATAPGHYTLTVDEPPTTESRRSRTLAGATPKATPAPQRATAAPAKPRGLTATATYDRVVLTWNDPGDASITGYVILRRVRVNNTGGEFSELVADTGTAATTYTDDSVQAATTYTYRIKAINAHGASPRSRWFHIDIPAAPEPAGQAAEPPAKPTGLSATATHNQVVLTWDDPGDASITGYVILRRVRENNVGGAFSELVPDTGSAVTTYTDATVQAATTYTYRIKAINEHGVSERSRWSHINVPAAPEAVEGDDPDGEDGGGAPGHATPPGPGGRANVSEPDGEDLPADTTTTGEVDVGGSVTGNIRNVNDKDWFAVELEAGKRYQIDMEGADTGRGTLTHPRVGGIYDAASNAIANTANDGGGVGNNARVIYTPDAAGTYYVEAYLKTGVVNRTYTLSVIVLGATGASEADTDFPADNTTTGRVDVGASATGNVGADGDDDWFRVDLEVGKIYQIDLEGAASGSGTLPDPVLWLYDTTESHIVTNDDGPLGFDSQIIHEATATGAYYLRAAALPTATTKIGTYRLSVTEVERRSTEGDTDFSSNNNTLGRVDVGGSATGNIERAGDLDGFRVDLEAGKAYQFDLEGAHTGRGTLANPLLHLENSGGDPQAANDDIDRVNNFNSRFEFRVTATGVYYLLVGDSERATGTYTLSVRDITSDRVPDDSGNVSEGNLDLLHHSSSLGQVTVGGTVTGAHTDGDKDWFALFDMQAGKRYQIDVEGADTGRGTHPDPAVSLYSISEVLIVSDNDSGMGTNARIIFTPIAEIHGRLFFVEAADDSKGGGTYTLSVRDITLLPPEADFREGDGEDLPADTTTTGVVEVGGFGARGAIHEPNAETVTWTGIDEEGREVVHESIVYDLDTDWFAVVLEAGKTYQIDMKGQILSSPGLDSPGVPVDPELTLSLPQINAIYDADGDYLFNTWARDESSAHHLFRVTFHARAGGTYYIAASGESFEWGGYELRVIDITEDAD